MGKSGITNDLMRVRFWIPEESEAVGCGQMVYPEAADLELDSDTTKDTYVVVGEEVFNISEALDNYRVERCKAIPMYAAQIEDLEGNIIYQGDIVELQGTDSRIEVVLKSGMFGLLGNKDGKPILHPLFTLVRNRGVTIKGNIHQDPLMFTMFRGVATV